MTYVDLEEGTRAEGFWGPNNTPVPTGFVWPGETSFLIALAQLERDAERIRYRGWSTCRLCGRPNGSETFVLNGWRWPSGFRHYVEDHHVVPSGDFLLMVSGHKDGREVPKMGATGQPTRPTTTNIEPSAASAKPGESS